jgi:hypothetical protein
MSSVILKICTSLFSWFSDMFKENRKRKEQQIAKRKVSSLKPQEVYTDFKSHPNQHKYRGYKVKWYCEFGKLETSLIYTQIHLKCNEVNVLSKISLNEYPELKNAKEGKKYVITGIIDRTEKSGIYLSTLIKLEKDTFFVI